MNEAELRAVREQVAALEARLAPGEEIDRARWARLAEVEVPLLLTALAAAAEDAPAALAQFVVVRAMALKNRVERLVKPAVAGGAALDAAGRAEVRQAVSSVREILGRLAGDAPPGRPGSRLVSLGERCPAICDAIERRAVLAFDYAGRPRVVAPYCHGLSTRRAEVLRAVQLGGWEGAGLGFGKLWAVAKMENVRPTGTRFRPDDPSYNPDDRAMLQIHCRVERR